VLALVLFAPTVTVRVDAPASGLALLVLAGAGLVAARLIRRRPAGAAARRATHPGWRTRTADSDALPAHAEETSPRRLGGGHATADLPLTPVRARVGSSSGPALRGPGGSSVTPLAATLDRSRRLMAAERRVADELAGLPPEGWVVERYVLVGPHRLPFLIMGTGGVFALAATDGAWTIRDLDALSRIGGELGRQLPEHGGTVHPAVCLAFDEMAPRSWHGGTDVSGRGGWVLGIDWLKAWLCTHDPRHGITPKDLAGLDVAAGPRWARRRSARLPASRNVG